MNKLHITEKDRLLAAGLLSFIIAFILIGSDIIGSDITYDTISTKSLIIIGVFAAGALVFSISPMLRGSFFQKVLALLFVLPSLAFAAILVRWFISEHLR